MLEILYRDEQLVAINKPSGLLVHRSLIDTRERAFAVQMTRDQIGQRVFPVHRLDRPTSGVLLFALSSEIARTVSEQFAARQVVKHYLGLVRGHTEQAGRLDKAIKEKLDRIADAQADPDKAAQDAVTDFRRLATVELPYPVGRYESARYSLLELQPHTGRKHQLRRHMKQCFHPMLGDTNYGDGVHNRFVRTQFDCHRLMLHAHRLQLTHPVDLTPMTIHAPLPPSFADPLAAMGFKLDGLVPSSEAH